MKELSIEQSEQVSGGVVAVYWVEVGAYRLYQSSKIVRTILQAGGGGIGVGLIKGAEGD